MTPPQWTDTTPAAIDSCFERHKLTWADATGPVGDLMRELHRRSVANQKLVEKVMGILEEGDADPRMVLSSLLTSGYIIGWHLRDEQDASVGVCDLMSDGELALLRAEIEREVPVRRSPILLPPITPPPVTPSERIVE